jgi:hypothetical protein
MGWEHGHVAAALSRWRHFQRRSAREQSRRPASADGKRRTEKVSDGKSVGKSVRDGKRTEKVSELFSPCPIIADPKFVAAAQGDFCLKEGSPALGVGFRPLDVSRAGRTLPPLLTRDLPPVPKAFE